MDKTSAAALAGYAVTGGAAITAALVGAFPIAGIALVAALLVTIAFLAAGQRA